jgi:hypothetical protein
MFHARPFSLNFDAPASVVASTRVITLKTTTIKS